MPDPAGSLLADAPFDFLARRDGKVFIRWTGRTVTILKGPEAARFLKRASGLEGEALQLLLAKVTGNFKRGNEKGRGVPP